MLSIKSIVYTAGRNIGNCLNTNMRNGCINIGNRKEILEGKFLY